MIILSFFTLGSFFIVMVPISGIIIASGIIIYIATTFRFFNFVNRITIKQRTQLLLDDFIWMGAFNDKNTKGYVLIVNKDNSKEIMTGDDFKEKAWSMIDAFIEARKVWRNSDEKWLNEFKVESERLKLERESAGISN